MRVAAANKAVYKPGRADAFMKSSSPLAAPSSTRRDLSAMLAESFQYSSARDRLDPNGGQTGAALEIQRTPGIATTGFQLAKVSKQSAAENAGGAPRIRWRGSQGRLPAFL